MRLLLSACLVVVLVTVAPAHEIDYDYSREACVPGGAHVEATHNVRFDEASGEYVLTATSERGRVSYRVKPGGVEGATGLLAVSAALDDAAPVLITGGVILTGRDADGWEIALDGRRYIATFEHADVDADGPGGYVLEPTGHGPCIRIGGEIPMPPHTAGHVTVPLGVEAGRWMVGVRYMDDRDDQPDDAAIALSIADEEIGRIALDRDDDAWRERLFEVDVPEDAVLTIAGQTDASGQDFCRISDVVLRRLDAVSAEVVARLQDDAVILQMTPAVGDLPPIRAELSLRGTALRCAIRQSGEVQAPVGYSSMTLQPSEPIPGVRIFAHPYMRERIAILPDGGFCSTVIDRFSSHCGDYRISGTTVDDRFSGFGQVDYLANSAGEFYDFNEDLWVTLSPRHIDCLPTFEGRRRTEGRDDISHRVVFDHWRMASGPGLERQVRMMGACGMTEMLGIWHTWMHYGYDRKQPQFTPANPDRWSEEQFDAGVDAAHESGWRVAVHENYNHMDWDSLYNSPTPAHEFGEPNRPGSPDPSEGETLRSVDNDEYPEHRPRNPWALARNADLLVASGPLTRPSPPAFPMSSDKMLFYSQIESHRIKRLYDTSAGYLDVTPCNEPGMGTWDTHIDLDARNRNARGFDQGYRNAWRLFDHHRSVFGITTGEGGNSASYHAGHIDAVERQVRGRMQAAVLPEHELRVIRPLSFHHGMGYYSRFFDRDAPSSTYDFDLYRAMQVAFGHAGFIGDPLLPGHIPGPEAIREYYLMRTVQEVYADADLRSIEYSVDREWISGDEALTRGIDLNQARLRISYANGLEIALNFDRDQDWALQLQGTDVVLPPKGWVALCDRMDLSAGTVRTDEGILDFCSAPAYEYANERWDTGAGHVVARAQDLPGLSEREAPGMLACLRDGTERLDLRVPPRLSGPERLNLTVINSGETKNIPVNLTGIDVNAPVVALNYQGDREGSFRNEVRWESPKAGTWRLYLAYTYTDPGHIDEAGGVELIDEFDGPALVVGDGAEGETVASAERRGNFVEVEAEVHYPQRVSAGDAMTFRLDRMRFGETIDDDYALDVRMVLRNEATGESVELAFPEVSVIQRKELDALEGEFEFPANSITTFEIG